MDFKDWLEKQGCKVEITQEDGGSGYVCLYILTPDGRHFNLTVDS